MNSNIFLGMLLLAFCVNLSNTYRTCSGKEWNCGSNMGTCGISPCNSNAFTKRAHNNSGSTLSSFPSVSITGFGLNYATSSVVLQQRDPGTSGTPSITQPAELTIAGIPSRATLLKAYVWAGGPSDGLWINQASISITNPNLVITTGIDLEQIGAGPSMGWGSFAGSTSWRADVTNAMGSNLNGDYLIDGVPVSTFTDTNGLTLFIIYNDPLASYVGTLYVGDGAMVRSSDAFVHTLTFPSTLATDAQFTGAFILAADIQDPPTDPSLNPYQINGASILGYAPPYMWTHISTTSINLLAGASQVTFGFNNGVPNSDFVLYVATGVYFQQVILAE